MAEAIIAIPWGQEKEVRTNTFGDLEHFLGAIGMTPDGRLFRWAFSGGAIGAGQRVESSPAVAADDQDLAVQANGAVGDGTISVTTGGAVAANLYQDGYVFTNDGAGEGHMYAIRSHPATTGVATLVLTLHENLREAVTSASTLVGFVKNPYKDVIIGGAASNAGAALGVAPTEVTDNDYFWVQVSGIAATLAEAAEMVIGDGIEMGVDVAGSFQLFDVSAETNKPSMGVLMQVAPDGANGDSAAVLLGGIL